MWSCMVYNVYVPYNHSNPRYYTVQNLNRPFTGTHTDEEAFLQCHLERPPGGDPDIGTFGSLCCLAYLPGCNQAALRAPPRPNQKPLPAFGAQWSFFYLRRSEATVRSEMCDFTTSLQHLEHFLLDQPLYHHPALLLL